MGVEKNLAVGLSLGSHRRGGFVARSNHRRRRKVAAGERRAAAVDQRNSFWCLKDWILGRRKN